MATVTARRGILEGLAAAARDAGLATARQQVPDHAALMSRLQTAEAALVGANYDHAHDRTAANRLALARAQTEVDAARRAFCRGGAGA